MLYFVIPVYNEEDNLERLLTETKRRLQGDGQSDFMFIFINDGSTDNSLEVLNRFKDEGEPVLVCSHFPNEGVRQTFLEGFYKFLEVGEEGDLLITKEADNTSDNAVLGQMVQILQSKDIDIVLASCYAKGGGVRNTTFFRRFLSSGANLLIKIRFNMWGLHTFSSFYRGFKYSCLEKAFAADEHLMTHEGFSCVVEMLIKLKKMNFKISEVPMVLNTSERKGNSKMPIGKTIRGYLKLCLSRP